MKTTVRGSDDPDALEWIRFCEVLWTVQNLGATSVRCTQEGAIVILRPDTMKITGLVVA